MSIDLSFAGSCDPDLTRSKAWLCQHLPCRTWKHVYVLGSWYGNLGLIMRWLGVDFDRLTNVDVNPGYCRSNLKLYQLAKFDRPCRIMRADCNSVDYSDADLVINTSTNDIPTHEWFSKILPGCWVAIQCRNNQSPGELMDRPATYSEFKRLFYMSSIEYAGKMSLRNQDGMYERYQLIGCK